MTKGKRKKRTWIIATVVCAVVIALVVAAIILLSNKHDEHFPNANTPLPALALEDILYGRVNPNSFNATWVSGIEKSIRLFPVTVV